MTLPAYLDTFTLHDAGFLLIDQKPVNRDPEIENEARAVTGQLVQAVREGKLLAKKPEGKSDCNVIVTYFDERKEADSTWLVSREALVNWENALGKKPGYESLDTFTLHDAGFLLIDQKPGNQDPEIIGEARMITGLLVQSVGERKLPAKKKPEKDSSNIKKIVHRVKSRNTGGDAGEYVEFVEYPAACKTTVKLTDEYKKADSAWLVDRKDLINWANEKGQKPVFLFGQETPQLDKPVDETVSDRLKIEPGVVQPLRECQIHKKEFQNDAKDAWETNPTYTQAAIVRLHKMDFYSRHYTEKILLTWASEVDPRPPEKRRGRPRKNTPSA